MCFGGVLFMKKYKSIKYYVGLLLLSVCLLGLLTGNNIMAKTQAGDEIVLRKVVIGTYRADGSILFNPQGDPARDRQALEYILNNDKPKKLIIPSGKRVEVDAVIDIGDNTTVIATGATIVQKKNGYGLIKHNIDKIGYGSIKNITIQGGTWKNKVNSKGCTMFRFAHGSNLKIKNVTIETNYKGHALELIACQNVVVDSCKLYAANKSTKSKNSVEEALQIDLATPITAPGVYQSTGNKKFVSGQTCKNVTVKNCKISGSRGICANFSASEPKFKNKFHVGITIENCEAIGETGEGIALFNSVKVKVNKSIIRSNSARKKEAYSVGLHLALMGKNKISTKYTNTITNNKIYGYRQALNIDSHTTSLYGKTTVKNNVGKASDKKTAFHMVRIKKLIEVNNKSMKR